MADLHKSKISELKQRLEKMLSSALQIQAVSAAGLAPPEFDQQSVGRLSRMDAIQVQQMAIAADRLRTAEISRIRRALQKIKDGEYGCCGVCSNAIETRRLDADPAAFLCVNCASAARQ